MKSVRLFGGMVFHLSRRNVRTISVPLLLFFLGVSSFANPKKQLSLEAIFSSKAFDLTKIDDMQWMPDGNAFTYIKKSAESDFASIYRHDIKTGRESVIIDGKSLLYQEKPIRFSSYKWIEHGTKALFTANEIAIWRRSTKAQYFIYEINTARLKPLIKGSPHVLNAKISPDREWVGYVQDNNIYVYEVASGAIRPLTFDGNNDIINGNLDWVYEEEFGISDGWAWSPDSRKIAYWRFDQSNVPLFSWVDYEPLNNKVETLRYPKAGQQNAIVTIGVVAIADAKTTWMDVGRNSDMYIPRMQWIDKDNLSIQRLNRLQNKLELLSADVLTGRSTIILTDQYPAWVDVHKNFSVVNKNQFIWTSERSGFNHIYVGDFTNQKLSQITDGAWEVLEVYGSDGKRIFFKANKENTIEQNIYSIEVTGEKLTLLIQEHGLHKASFSNDYRFFVDHWSSASTPWRYELYNSTGKKLRTLIKNDLPAFNEYCINYPEFLTFATGDGVLLNARMFKPAELEKDKKYPVIIYGYGGPASQTVLNEWGNKDYHQRRSLWLSMLAQQGYVVFTVDNRGTGGRGKEFKNLAYGDISKYVVADLIEGAKYLATLPFVDKERLAVWGWSGGGYLTLHAMFRAADYFKVGISVAPVSDLRLYDTIWTERYMGLPSANKAGYDAASAISYIDGLKGKLLIVHGTADDNVHFQNVMRLIEPMQQIPVQFDLMVYPGLNHRINKGKSQLHLYTMMTEYFNDHL